MASFKPDILTSAYERARIDFPCKYCGRRMETRCRMDTERQDNIYDAYCASCGAGATATVPSNLAASMKTSGDTLALIMASLKDGDWTMPQLRNLDGPAPTKYYQYYQEEMNIVTYSPTIKNFDAPSKIERIQGLQNVKDREAEASMRAQIQGQMDAFPSQTAMATRGMSGIAYVPDNPALQKIWNEDKAPPEVEAKPFVDEVPRRKFRVCSHGYAPGECAFTTCGAK